jgi:hypothetical protein
VDAYAQWVDAPGWRREFPRPEFALAVYALDVSGVRSTSKGVTFELIGPSAGPKKSDILTVRSEDGGVRRYYGIRFRE